LSAMYPGAVGNIVHIKLKEGRTSTMRLDHAPGHAKNRLSDDQLLLKYHTLSDPIVGKDRAGKLADWVWKLDGQTDLSGVFRFIEM